MIDLLSAQAIIDGYRWQDLLGFFIRYWGNQSGLPSHVNQALTDQVGKILHQPNLYHNQLQEDVANLLIGDKDYLAFFCNSGAEANEAAIKIARKASGKQEIITFQNSFHGRTFDLCLPLVRIKSNKVLVKVCPTLAMLFSMT